METLKIWFEYHEISDTLRVHINSSKTQYQVLANHYFGNLLKKAEPFMNPLALPSVNSIGDTGYLIHGIFH